MKEIIETRTREVGRLREELAYLQQVRKLGENLRDDLEYAMERMQLAVIQFREGQKTLDRARPVVEEDWTDTPQTWL